MSSAAAAVAARGTAWALRAAAATGPTGRLTRLGPLPGCIRMQVLSHQPPGLLRRCGWHSSRSFVALTRRAAAAPGDGDAQEMRGEVKTVHQLFSQDSLYALPPIQRHYDWREDEATALLEDLLSSLGSDGTDDVFNMQAFILGNINLAPGPLIPKSRVQRQLVVDGQQRMVTLLLLFAAAHEHVLQVDPGLAAQVCGFLKQPRNPVQRLETQLRLQLLRQQDTDFLEQLLCNADFRSGPQPQLFGESQPNMWANCQLFRRRLAELPPARVALLVEYVLVRVTVTATISSSLSHALKYFSLMQRGKQLQPVDALKGNVFAAMAEAKQDEYGRRWTELEQLQGAAGEPLGRDGISAAALHVCTIHVQRQRGAGNEYADLERLQQVLTGGHSGPAGAEFFDQVLEPYVKAYASMVRAEAPQTLPDAQQRKRCGYLLAALNRLRPEEWRPLVLAALMQHSLGHMGPQALLALLEDVDRLAWMWTLCGTPKADRVKRVQQALQELGLGAQQPAAPPPSPLQQQQQQRGQPQQQQQMVPRITAQRAPCLQLEQDETAAMTAALDGNVYTALPKVGKPVVHLLLRLNELLLQGEADYVRYDVLDSKLTVEHILPQNPPAGSEWTQWFDPQQHRLWLHRLGNLVLLHSARNSRASNKPFDEKKERYRAAQKSGKMSLTLLPLTDEVGLLPSSKWGPAQVQQRQAELLALAKRCWRL